MLAVRRGRRRRGAAPSPRAGELVEGDRAGDAGVERLYPSRPAFSQGDGHAVADLAQHQIAEAGAFGADADERRTRELDRPQRRAVVRDETVDPRRAELARRLGELHLAVERQGEDGAHAAAHHLGRVEVDAPRRGDQRGGRERGRRAHERAHVAGIGHAVGVHGEQVGAPQRLQGRGLGQGKDGHDLGRRLQRRELLGDAASHEMDLETGQAGVALGGRGGLAPFGHEHGLRPPPGRERGGHEIGALGEESALSLAMLAQRKRSRPLDERVLEA